MPKPVRTQPPQRRPATVHLQDWLDYKKMNAGQLAARMETTKSVVSKLINGKQRYNQEWLERIAFVFECEVRDLYDPPMDPASNSLLAKMTPENRKTAINVLIDLAGDRKDQ